MAQDALRTLRATMEAVRPALTAPGFRNALVLMVGWVLTNGVHAVTAALVASDVSGRRHHEAFHRFFSRGAWQPDTVGRLLAQRIVARLVPEGAAIRVAIDDTLAHKKGAHVFGIGSHIDAVRSTKAVRIFAFGHVWIVLALLVDVPFSSRTWALPVLFRLYRNQKNQEAEGGTYKRKTDLAREAIDQLASWFPDRRIELAMDSAYCNDTVLRGLDSRLVVFGAMRPDAVLTALPEPVTAPRRPGRPARRGKSVPKPEQLARDESVPWSTVTIRMYGRPHAVRYKTLDAQWYVAAGARLLRIVVVRTDAGKMGLRVFFSTDPTLSVEEILRGYSNRWSIESTFKDLKQHLGFGDSAARKKAAVERTAPFAGFLFTILVLWFADGVHALPLAEPPNRPWYRRKRDASMADIVRAAQRVLAPAIADPGRPTDNPGKFSTDHTGLPRSQQPPEDGLRREAA